MKVTSSSGCFGPGVDAADGVYGGASVADHHPPPSLAGGGDAVPSPPPPAAPSSVVVGSPLPPSVPSPPPPAAAPSSVVVVGAVVSSSSVAAVSSACSVDGGAIVRVKSAVLPLPAASIAVQVIVATPGGSTEPEGGSHEIVMSPPTVSCVRPDTSKVAVPSTLSCAVMS